MEQIKKEATYNFQKNAISNLSSPVIQTSNVQRPSYNKGNNKKLVNIIGQSLEVIKLLNLIERIAHANSNVLITGETGTGKELVARRIQSLSSRANKPLVSINCGAIPSEILESELFGHVKGAFTGAISDRKGRFEMANGGTLFLDEIGDMSCHLQVKLLRVLQEKEFEPVGSEKTLHVDVRIIAATNKNLEKAVAEARFREDLFYRLNVLPVYVPSLRQRRSDIPLLVEYFIKKFNQLNQKKIEGVFAEAMNLLYWYAWPGNVRQLENLIERLVFLNDGGIIDVHDIPSQYQVTPQCNSLVPAVISDLSRGIDLNSVMNQYESSLILKALEKTGWNRNQAALLLNINRTTLVEKMKKKGLKS